MTTRPLTANIYFDNRKTEFYTKTIGEFSYVEKAGVRSIFTDFFHTDITGVTEEEQELIDSDSAVFLGKVSMEEWRLYVPPKFSEMYEK